MIDRKSESTKIRHRKGFAVQVVFFRVISVVLSFIFMLSGFMTGTLSWQSFNHHALNETCAVMTHDTDVELIKYEKLFDGTLTETPLAGASFYLFQEDGTQLGGRFVTDDNGKIAVNLPQGNYYFEEKTPPSGFTFDTENGEAKTRYPFVVADTKTDTVVVQAYNIRKQGSLSIEKQVQNADGAPLTEEQKRQEFSFEVTFSDNGAYSYFLKDEKSDSSASDESASASDIPAPNDNRSISFTSGDTLRLKHGQVAVFPSLPVGVTYHVKEQPVNNYTSSGSGHTGTITQEGCKALFVNTYSPGSTGSLTVTKTIKGDGADENKEFWFTAVINGQANKFKLKGGGSQTFTDLPANTEYRVSEEDYTEDGYTPQVLQYEGFVNACDVSVDFVNVFNKTGNTGDLTIEKEVIGENADPNKEFSFEVTFSDGGTYSYSLEDKKSDLSLSDKLTSANNKPTFTGDMSMSVSDKPMPADDAIASVGDISTSDSDKYISFTSGDTLKLKQGQVAVFHDVPDGVHYFVREIDTAGYLPDVVKIDGFIVGGENAVAHFTNRVPSQPDEFAVIRVTKALEGEYPAADANKEFGFTLTANGVKTEFTLKPNETKEFRVPAKTQYEVRENDYYADGYAQSITNGIGTAFSEQVTEVYAVNTYVGEVLTEISGEKIWILGDFGMEVLPESITVRLICDGLLVEEQTITPDENGDWRYCFTAPKYDAQGQVLVYTVAEAPLDGFIASYDGLNIINTYVAPTQIELPIIRKITEGDNIPETQFSFMLKGENGAPMPEDSGEGGSEDRKIVSLLGSGEVSLGAIHYANPGVYVYTVSELTGDGDGWIYDTAVYTFTVTVTLENGALHAEGQLTKDGNPVSESVFVNRYAPPVPEDIVDIRGKKTWNHGDNPYERQPKSIIVCLYADGDLKAQKLVDASTDWNYSFVMPEFAKDGHKIVYAIGEVGVDNYRASVDGYDLLNTYVSPTPPASGGSSGSGDAPRTGDDTQVKFWLTVMICSLMALTVTMRYSQRKNSSKSDRTEKS